MEMNKQILHRKVRCVKGGDLDDEFTFGQVYDVEIGGVILNNFGDPFFMGTDANYEFEEITE